MLELHINVKKNICKISQPTLTSGCVNAVACLFSFDDSWNGYELTASFESAYGTYHCLIEAGKCKMPNAIVAHASSVKIGVIGKKGDVTVATNTDTFLIDEGANKEGGEDSDYQPTLLEQILSITEKCKQIAQSVYDDAAAGKFNGKDYVLTDEDKKKIAETAAENVVNDYAIRETIYIGLDGYCYSADGIAYSISNLDIISAEDLKKYNFVLLWDIGEEHFAAHLDATYVGTGEMYFSSLVYDNLSYQLIAGTNYGIDEAIDFVTTEVTGEYLNNYYGVLSVDKTALLGDIGDQTMKEYTDNAIGDIESALDEIIAIQNTLIGETA